MGVISNTSKETPIPQKNSYGYKWICYSYIMAYHGVYLIWMGEGIPDSCVHDLY